MPDDIRITPDMLPGMLSTVAHVAGVPKALRLAKEKGGGKIWLPTPEFLKPDHWLAEMFGLEKARKIVLLLGSDSHKVPSAGPIRNWYRANRLYSAGLKVPEIARRLRLSESQIARLVSPQGRRPGPRKGSRYGINRPSEARQRKLVQARNPDQLDLF